MDSEKRNCHNCHQNFTIESEDFDFYKKIDVPPPTWCPECRMIRRMMWRNERVFYHRNCNLCDEKTISVFEKGTVYCQNCWLGEKWNPIDYGRDYDFSKPFFEQYLSLFKDTPQMNLNGHILNKNSPYVNYIVEANNCYLCFGGGYIDNVMFSNIGVRIKDSAEIYFSTDCELCYEILNCQKCRGVYYGNNLKDCMDSYFLQDCVNCNECIMSCNLRNKSFYFKNKQYTKEEYLLLKEKFLEQLQKDPSIFKKEFNTISVSSPKKFSNIVKSEFSTGNNITESSKITNSFNVSKCEVCKNSQDVIGIARDVYDSTSIGINLEKVYESMSVSLGITNSLFSLVIRNNSFDIRYSFALTNCSHCFACTGLRNKQYCILNKQYTKEEYESLVPKIIQHMHDMPYIDAGGRIYAYGEFFPSELSPFTYNETIAQECFPLTKEEALMRGYKWKDEGERSYKIDIRSSDIPEDASDNILNKTLECSHKRECNHQCATAFKIIPQELQFYRRMNLPLPRLCPNCRHYERLAQRNPLKLWHRSCQCSGTQSEHGVYTNTAPHEHGAGKCANEFETSYDPDRKEIIYCEACYQAEVI